MELRQEAELDLKVSQRMLQGLSVLQMGTQELKEYLEEAMLENPVFELEEPYGEGKKQDREELLHWLQRNDCQNRVYYQEEKQDEVFFAWKEETSLEEYLLEQLLYMDVDGKYIRILKYMIQNLDDRGYYTETFAETARNLREKESVIERAKELLCAMEPPGVGAKDLKECLLLQLREKEGVETAREIIENYMEEFGKNKRNVMAKKMGKTVEEINLACEWIRNLNPKPSNCFSSRRFKEYLIPDLLIVKLKDYFEILVNDSQCPKIVISTYYEKLFETTESRETADYIKEKLDKARWLESCVEQRRNMLGRLGEWILKQQMEFFKSGRKSLKSLTQKQAAQELGVHPSTISRAVKDKYLQCAWGTYPLSFFFSVGGICEEERKETSESLKEYIKELIYGENKKKPYSDRIIAEKLQDTGISISRRTVAKYRESMGIGDALSRKQF